MGNLKKVLEELYKSEEAQTSKLYTEEEVFELMLNYTETMWMDDRTLYSNESMRVWFEQNKKK